MTKAAKVGFLGILSVLFAATCVILYFGYQILMTSVSSDSTEIVFDVGPGVTLAQIANDLEAKQLIRNSKSFQIYAKFKNQASKIKVGEYALSQALTPDQILAVLVEGKSIARAITITEGLNLFDIAEIFEKNKIASKEEFFQLVHDKTFIFSLLHEDLASLEGYLFPETYKVTKFDGAKAVLAQMVGRFLTVWKDVEADAAKLQWSRNQTVIFASIVEKETGASADRGRVSSVFHNRLKKSMKLQTDPTVLYGMAVKIGKMPDNITKNDLLTPTPYNTYTNLGLPPTPISNPGKAALLAAVHPEVSNFLFFVSRNDGTTAFSETIEQHNLAVQQFQLNAKNRENKSWRDLKEASADAKK